MTEEQQFQITKFIQINRKICWEAEFQKGEFCIGEETVRKILKDIFDRPEKYGLKKLK